MYRTKLREGAAEGPNFAGHYTIVLWGCGTGCPIVSVVDARIGRLSSYTLLAAGGVEYRRDSRLIFADPPTPEQLANCASWARRLSTSGGTTASIPSAQGLTLILAAHEPGRRPVCRQTPVLDRPPGRTRARRLPARGAAMI